MLDGILNPTHSTSVWSEAQSPKSRLRGAIGLMHFRRHDLDSTVADRPWIQLSTNPLTSDIAHHTSPRASLS
jgi:hypothetical protein